MEGEALAEYVREESAGEWRRAEWKSGKRWSELSEQVWMCTCNEMMINK